MKHSKSAVSLALLVLSLFLVLAGCDFFAGLFDPLIGTWQGTFSGVTFSLTLKGDKSFSITSTGILSGTASGSYSEDTAAHVLTLTVTTSTFQGSQGGPSVGSWVANYSLSSDNKTLTLTPQGVGAMVLTKQ